MRLVLREKAERCLDCELRGALDPMGKPRTSRVYGYKLTQGCEGCAGSGRGGRKLAMDAEEALASLTDKQRFVIERRFGYVDGKRYTLREIAEVMGIALESVYQHEALAKKKLAVLMGIPKK